MGNFHALFQIKIEAVSLDGTIVKVHPAGRDLMRSLPDLPARCRLIMDRAYE